MTVRDLLDELPELVADLAPWIAVALVAVAVLILCPLT